MLLSISILLSSRFDTIEYFVATIKSCAADAALTEAGAIILPATPSFYSLPESIEEVCQTVTERVTAMLGIECKRYEWRG